ncbi:MAG: GAF domain-containing protein [Leptospiraceae bacterium]|nr:GAF domain-containing protein [Leptospiraceae bacterium]
MNSTLQEIPGNSNILRRLLAHLGRSLDARYLCLQKGGQVAFEIGTATPDVIERPFSSYILCISTPAAGDFSPADERLIRHARKLFDILLRGLRILDVDGRERTAIPSGYLIESYLEVLALLEERSSLVEFYDRMLQLNERILMAEDLFSVLQIIMDTATVITAGEASSLLLVDQKTGEMYFNVVSGENKTQLKEIRIPSGQGIAGSIVKNARAEIIRDVAGDPRTFQRVDQALGHTTRDMIAAPIIARGRVIGVIEVINSEQPQGFRSEELELLTNIAGHTSLFIENIKSKEDLIRTNRALDRKNSEVNALYEIGRVLNSSLDPQELKGALLRTLLRLMQIGEGAILEPTADRRTFIQTVALINTDNGIIENESGPTRPTFEAVADIALWLKQYNEPYYFFDLESGNPAPGLAERFLRENARLLESINAPDLWLPVFDEHQEILFIISLGRTNYRRRDPVSDLTFFRGVMNQSYTAFRNVSSYRSALEAREKEQQIRRAFQKYVPARVVAELLEQESPPPTQQTISILFADIRNFSPLAEKLQPALLADLLNEFFEIMVDVVNKHDGVVDKFMGDSLMALFGVPDPRADDAARAVQCARHMQQSLTKLNRARAEQNRPSFEMGIGLHTGSAIVGNFGSRQRLDFTAIGDSVNLASRLEKASKFYRVGVLFTKETYDATHREIAAREVDLVQVRGRETPTLLYQPFDFGREGPDSLRADWEAALQMYRQGHFTGAHARFQALRDKFPADDPLIPLYLQRCEHFRSTPPAANWDGIFRVDAQIQFPSVE